MGNDQIPKKERGYITKQISLTPLIRLRTWFGLILKITVRMKSYTHPKQCYFTKPPDS